MTNEMPKRPEEKKVEQPKDEPKVAASSPENVDMKTGESKESGPVRFSSSVAKVDKDGNTVMTDALEEGEKLAVDGVEDDKK